MMSRRDAVRSYRRALRRATRALLDWHALQEMDGRVHRQLYETMRARYGRMLNVTRTPHLVCTAIDRDAGVITYEGRFYT